MNTEVTEPAETSTAIAVVKRQPWDKLDKEPYQSYKHFLFYLRCGPKRTVTGAYKVWMKNQMAEDKEAEAKKDTKKDWVFDSRQYYWVERSSAYDCNQMLTYGKSSTSKFMRSLDKAMTGIIKALGKHEPDSWSEAMESLSAITQILPPDLIQAILASRRSADEYVRHDEPVVTQPPGG